MHPRLQVVFSPCLGRLTLDEDPLLGSWGKSLLTCPQADNDPHVLRILFHDDGCQDLAAQQGGLEAVGEGVEAAVAQHGDLIVEGAARERKLWGQEAASGVGSHPGAYRAFTAAREFVCCWTGQPSFPSHV